MNVFKTVFFLTLLTLLLILVGGWIGGREGMVIAFSIALVMNFVTYWFSDRIVLAMYKAKQVTRADYPKLFTIVSNLSTKAGLPMPKVYVMPVVTPNAFATGRDPSHAAVAATEGIIRLLSDDELEGVIAHELSHVRNRDTLVMTAVATIAGAIYMISDMARFAMIFGGRGDDDRDGGNPMAALALIILAPIAATLIQLAISRSREYMADDSGADICGRPLSLANALRKLHGYSRRMPMDANPVTAHMFIVNPLTGRGFLSLFSTHPPIERRIARLEELAIKPR
ncbi:MAG TPA: zinc metalloprotease HtpX [Candidatus Omnitrophota bacterium]|nr:zinc metalloprotease HtpX [Candidatus Omnitrophota bacterium]HOX09528.1 zinc metalloprotease HtpX [Candidatus Omnitrophota bacterium]HPN66235.1 zinc metalloprotease HtpX [Candidatus Omnitrophota bacterium]HRZ66726.1 zinc metalloprotease HtpX [Candidatus Omnitrophota bacterium]